MKEKTLYIIAITILILTSLGLVSQIFINLNRSGVVYEALRDNEYQFKTDNTTMLIHHAPDKEKPVLEIKIGDKEYSYIIEGSAAGCCYKQSFCLTDLNGSYNSCDDITVYKFFNNAVELSFDFNKDSELYYLNKIRPRLTKIESSDNNPESSEPIVINSIDDFLSSYDLRMHVTFEPTGIGFIINVSGNKLYYVTVNVNRENTLDDLTEQHTLSEDEMKTLEEYCNYLRSGYELKEAKGFDGIEVNIWLDDTCHYLRFGDQNDTIDEMVLFLSEFLPKDVSHIDELTNTKLLNQE